MARRSSFFVGLERAARAAARAQREAEAGRRRQAHGKGSHQLQLERENLRLHQQQDKWQREQYLASRQAEVEKLNAELADQVAALQALLGGRQNLTEDAVLGTLV